MSRTPGPSRPPGTIRIGQLAGIDVLITSSWFLIAGLITVLLAPYIDRVEPDLGNWRYLAGFAFVVVLYLSVLFHEAAHAVAARRCGMRVHSITLQFLGGMTALEGEARRPKHEFWISVLGPIASLVIGVAAFGLWFLAPEGLLQLTLEGLIGANLVIGLLNLVPGLPLDGGRVLRSAVWAASGDPHQGTIVAAWGGRAAAVVVLGYPLALAQITGTQVSPLDFVLAAIVALFLWTGASAALKSARIRRRYSPLVARHLARPVLAVSAELPLDQAVRRAADSGAKALLTTNSSGQLTGLVDPGELAQIPQRERAEVMVFAVAHPIAPQHYLPADLSGEALITAITRHSAERYLLRDEEGRVVGMLQTADVDAAFRQAP